jgi:hypothetical protein
MFCEGLESFPVEDEAAALTPIHQVGCAELGKFETN